MSSQVTLSQRIAEASQLLSKFMTVGRAEQKYKDNWLLFQALYTSAPQRFVVSCGIHQNNLSDRLHFSVNLKMNDVVSVPIHFNGFLMPNGGFFISEVTRKNANKQFEIIFETAERFPCAVSE